MSKIKDLIKSVTTKKVPTRNYYIVLIVSVLVVVLTLLIRSLYINYINQKTSTGAFNDIKINQINTEDIDFAFSEVNEAILYISYTGNTEIYEMEKRLIKEIEKKNLKEKVIYWDITDKLKNKEYLDILKQKFPNIDYEITQVPMLIYIEDGKAKEAMCSELRLIDYNVLNKLVDKYEIE